MTSDDLQLLREFRAGIPAPDEMTRRMAYAYATSAGASDSKLASHLRGVRSWGSGRRALALAVVLIALVIAAVAVAGPFLFGVSNHGTRAHANSLIRAYVEGEIFKKAGVADSDAAKPGTLRRLAVRQGIWIYSARRVRDNSLCFYMGLRPGSLHWQGHPNTPQIERGNECSRGGGQFALPAGSNFGYGRKAGERASAWLRTHPFPSSARPILDLSMVGAAQTKQPGCSSCRPLVWPGFGLLAGVAANGVHSVQVLSLSDCKPLVTVPVIDNVYIDARPPQVAAAFLVARDANGKIIWHSWQLENQNTHVPLKPGTAPQHCGFAKWLWTR